MPETKRFEIKEKRILFKELRHCIHSNKVKEKQGHCKVKKLYSSRAKNTYCTATIHLRLEHQQLSLSHPLEINIEFTHNHVINFASSLSFRHVDSKVHKNFITLFQDGHSPASALHIFEDDFYLNITNEQELLEILADRAYNPAAVVLEYNNSGQAQEICYMDASASFDPLNTSITLLYMSCAAGALPLGLFITSNELEITIEKAEHRQFWTLSFCLELPLRGNNTNNYIERGFGVMKDIIFTRTQAYNPVQMFQFITTSMERFYEKRLLRIANMYPGVLRIAKHFFCPGWEMIDPNSIQKTNMENEYLVPSTKENNGTNYIVNSEIGVCSCSIGMSSALCKHQGAVVAKFHVSIFNFIPSLTLDDRAIYAYIALGYITQNKSFYASLYTQPIVRNQEILCTRDKVKISNNFSRTGWKEPEVLNEESKDAIEINNSNFALFLEEVQLDYQNADQPLRIALDKFKDHYNSAKSKSAS
ncbi:37186_t:CDS:2 [Gigaspora margarita]|uniref:37186_t:CDS:1 n=1 Tax=Gigaspora margarita TaxID=4874 RepID=A0ABN7VJ55_GIGMA|nr:37186_t:CDS:2 [Gigaspora margarita]